MTRGINTFRCRICNAVNRPELCNETSPLYLKGFHSDGLDFMCDECWSESEGEYDDGLVWFYDEDEMDE